MGLVNPCEQITPHLACLLENQTHTGYNVPQYSDYTSRSFRHDETDQ